MRKLYLSIFVALLGVGLGCIGVAWMASATLREDRARVLQFASHAAHYLVQGVPRDDAEGCAAALDERARRLGMNLSMWDAEGKLLHRAGAEIPDPPRNMTEPRWVEARGHIWGLQAPLADGGFVAVARPHRHGPEHLFKLLGFLGCMLAVLALGSFWVAKRITRRLETLETGVARFGAGELSARVPLEGRDEVTRLAEAFNRASARIEGLVGQQRRMLRSASHELRTPLTRLRMALAVLGEEGTGSERRGKLLGDCTADIEELDALIEDLLMAARLEDSELPRNFETVDLHAIVTAEAERVGAEVQGTAPAVMGQPRMLRSVVRNLLENARRYGAPPLEVSVREKGGAVQLRIRDHGKGIAEAEHQRIFEPFYRPQGHAETRDGGVGLGLSLVRQVAEYHGGSAQYVEPEGGGACFLVELPLGGG